MPTYALLLPHAPDRYTNLSEDEYMDIIKDYVAWTEEMTAKGIYVDGHKLSDDAGRTLNRDNDRIDVHDGPMTELAEVLGGLMLIRADDYDAAVEIAKTCPHLVHNRSIQVRQIVGSESD